MKFLFVINDSSPTNIVHVRHTFREFVAEGAFSAYEEYPFRERVVELGSVRRMESDLLATISTYRPDVLLWNQVSGTSLSKKFLEDLRLTIPDAVLIQETADTYFSVPSAMLKVGRVFDMTLAGCGGLIPEFKKRGCNNVLLFPEKADHVRFGHPPKDSNSKQFDVVMIANRLRIRNPFRAFNWPGKNPLYHMDGQNIRDQLVKLFSERFGERFAIFGYGWDGCKSAKGFLKFGDQEVILQSSRISLGTNNFNNVNYYFSNRVPNSLISGIPHLCKRSKGIECFFRDKEHCFFFDTPEEALNKAEWLLDQSDSFLAEIGENGKRVVLEKHTARVRYEYLIELIRAFRKKSLHSISPEYFLEVPTGFTVL